MDRFILCHALKEGIPVFRLFTHVMDALGNICQRAVDIENHDFVCHNLLLITCRCEEERSKDEAIS